MIQINNVARYARVEILLGANTHTSDRPFARLFSVIRLAFSPKGRPAKHWYLSASLSREACLHRNVKSHHEYRQKLSPITAILWQGVEGGRKLI